MMCCPRAAFLHNIQYSRTRLALLSQRQSVEPVGGYYHSTSKRKLVNLLKQLPYKTYSEYVLFRHNFSNAFHALQSSLSHLQHAKRNYIYLAMYVEYEISVA
jgi:hypothetical protein